MGSTNWHGVLLCGVLVGGDSVRELKPSTWFGESLLQEWGQWCIQYLESFGHGGGAGAGRDDARLGKRAPGDHSDPVLAEIIGTEILGGFSQTLHLRIAERPAIDRRVAILRYVGKPMRLPEWGGEDVIWRGGIEIGGAARGERTWEPVIEFPEPQMLKTMCAPPQSPESIGRELEVTAAEVREATRRLRALAVKVFRRANAERKNVKRKAA